MAEHMNPIYRFYPTEEELISFYLSNKLQNHRTNDLHRVIPTVNVYQHNPCHLPRLAGELCRQDTEQWFFFVPRQEREEQGRRPSRTTASGYWKATGSSNYVYSSENKAIGMKKTMVFYEGKSRTVKKTEWKMNEYRAIKEEVDGANAFPVRKLRHEWSLCRVYVVSGTRRAFDRRPIEIRSPDTFKPEASMGESSSILKAYKPTSMSLSDCLCPKSSNPYHEMANIVDDGLVPQGDWKHFAG